MASWDSRSREQLTKLQNEALRRQVLDAVAPFSPWWRERLQALGRTAQSVASLDGLASLPAVGERDVCPDGDPAGAAGLVLQATEQGWALHAEGPRFRQGLLRRVVAPTSYAAIVEADTRPTSFVWAGLGMRFPIASTRRDLDVVARAGARLFAVLGIGRGDVVVSGLPAAATAAVQALSLAALGTGTPLLSPGSRVEHVADALHLVPATVLALPTAVAAARLDELAASGAPLGSLRVVLLVDAPYDEERAAVRDALDRNGVGAKLLAMHVPDGHRLAWGECAESNGETGLHTYPDLEVVDTVAPETGEVPHSASPRLELVVTQLALRGSVLLRWRTGDAIESIETSPCPGCRRTVPRVTGTARGALVPILALRSGTSAVDLRAVAAALVGRPDVVAWRVVVASSRRDGSDQLLVHVTPEGDATQVVTDVAQAVRSAAGLLPTQIVASDQGLPVDGQLLGEHLLVAP